MSKALYDSMCEFLLSLGARKRRTRPGRFILDEFDPEFYLEFDMEPDEDRPEVYGTCDILLVPLFDEDRAFRVCSDCKRHHVLRFMFALGVKRFSEKTKREMYNLSNPLREANKDFIDRLQDQHDRITRLMILNGRLKHRMAAGVCNFPSNGGPCGNCEACKETEELLREGWLSDGETDS